MDELVMEFQRKFPTKEEKIETLEKMSNEEIDKLIENSSNIYAKIFYNRFKKK